MEAKIASALARLDGQGEQIKGAFKRIDRIEDKLDNISKQVTAVAAISSILIPVATSMLIYFLQR
jgi:archaellum component FlaC|tara:strand:+ start:9694 stop:9888 length:195 start_codon:yes stop_codon:yes gene_type:complete